MNKPKKEYQIVRISKASYEKIMKKALKAKRTFIAQLETMLGVK